MNISAPIYTIIGIFLGWLLTQIGQWYKGRKEDNRIRGQVLYNLLEIYHLLKSNTDKIENNIEIIIQKLSTLIPEIGSNKVLQKQFESFLSPMISKFLREKFEAEFSEIEKSYKVSIGLLAPIDPIISYYLSGQTSGISYANDWINRVIAEIGVHITDKAQLAKGKDEVTNIIEQKIFTNSLNEIKSLILELALKIGPATRWRVGRILNNQIAKPPDNKELDQFLAEIVTSLKKNSAQ